jgi:hypothetical protein
VLWLRYMPGSITITASDAGLLKYAHNSRNR